MSSVSTPEQTNIVTWKVISTGTAVVLGLLIVCWLARTAEGERAAMDQQRADEMAGEVRTICAKWGMPAGSPKYVDCAADIDTLRANHERRIAAAFEQF
ncbi:MAG TPA: hypothetical protein VH558_10535 [Pseudolabrys sp.]|jgi:hypothetical protein